MTDPLKIAMNEETPTPKNFALSEDDLKPLVENDSACFATDMIVVENLGVSYMYREEPDFEQDSGWRFFAGAESKEYLADPNNLGIYSLNTIANYDPEIVPLLDSPVGSEFERDGKGGKFIEADPNEDGVEWIDANEE